MSSLAVYFSGYDDPKIAEQVFHQYLPKINLRANKEAIRIVKSHKTAADLELELDELSTGHSSVHMCGSPIEPPRGLGSEKLARIAEDAPLDI